MLRSNRSVLAVLTCLFGCGSSSDLEGVFELASWTTNTADCTSEGTPAFEQQQYSHFFVRQDDFFGLRLMNAVMCDSLSTCRTEAADQDTFYIGNFLFDQVDPDGWTGARGYLADADCSGVVFEAHLSGVEGESIRIEEHSKTVTDVARDADGDCDFDAARAQAAPQACEALTVVTGVFVEAI
jgi:hypothetical protein